METLNFAPLATFVIVTLYTPGPNNVSSASMGLVFGYLKTLPYIMGIMTGFIIVMFACGSMSGLIITLLPSVSVWLRWIGCAYILWLAYNTLRASYAFDNDRDIDRLGFFKGVFLQLVNIKGLIFGITLFTTFLRPVTTNPLTLLFSILVLSVLVFGSVTLWSLSGTAIKRFVTNPVLKKYINIFLSMLLVYTAFSILLMGN